MIIPLDNLGFINAKKFANSFKEGVPLVICVAWESMFLDNPNLCLSPQETPPTEPQFSLYLQDIFHFDEESGRLVGKVEYHEQEGMKITRQEFLTSMKDTWIKHHSSSGPPSPPTDKEIENYVNPYYGGANGDRFFCQMWITKHKDDTEGAPATFLVDRFFLLDLII